MDDHAIVLDGLQNNLEGAGDFEVVATARSGAEALTAVKRHTPDVVIADLSLGDMNGIELTMELQQLEEAPYVIAFSMHLNKRMVAEMLGAGAVGYVLKEAPSEEILTAIHSVMDGGMFLSPPVTRLVVKQYLKILGSAGGRRESALTVREEEVLRLLAAGYQPKGIADTLHISRNTVDSHRKNIMEKLHCRNFAELVCQAMRLGFVEPPEREG